MEEDAMRVLGSDVSGGHIIVHLRADCRVGGEYPYVITLSADGYDRVSGHGLLLAKHATPEPLAVTGTIGKETATHIPFLGQLWKNSTFKAHLEPRLKEFQLTASRGTMAAGAQTFPFQLVFTPTVTRKSVALLVVVFNDESEYVVEVTGAVGGFAGRMWAKRQHEARAPTRPQANFAPEWET
jgi:hypothetical protein